MEFADTPAYIEAPSVTRDQRSRWREMSGRVTRSALFYLPVWLPAFTYIALGFGVRHSIGPQDWTGPLRIGSVLRHGLSLVVGAGPSLLIWLNVIVLFLCAMQLIAYRRGLVFGPFKLLMPESRPSLRVAMATTTRVLAVLLFVSILALGLTQWKVSIPFMRPFAFDPLLMRIDYTLHLGNHPWELLHGGMFGAAFTKAIDAAYHPGWMWMTWCILPAILGSAGSSTLLRHYLLAFTIIMALLGTGLATLLTSAGPLFYDGVVGNPGPFAGLVERLELHHQAVPISALGIRDYLWSAYNLSQQSIGTGISAMPSVHVATAALTAIVMSRWSRWAAVTGVVYLLLILHGSVYLGWHYAVDSYVSVLFALLIWFGAGRFLSWYDAARSRRPRHSAFTDGVAGNRDDHMRTLQ